jgi:hypothetical protein
MATTEIAARSLDARRLTFTVSLATALDDFLAVALFLVELHHEPPVIGLACWSIPSNYRMIAVEVKP